MKEVIALVLKAPQRHVPAVGFVRSCSYLGVEVAFTCDKFEWLGDHLLIIFLRHIDNWCSF